MNKEILRMSDIVGDWKRVAKFQFKNSADRSFAFLIPLVVFFLVFGVGLKTSWIAILIALAALYPLVGFLAAWRKYAACKKAIRNADCRWDFCVSVETLSHIAKQTVYEPHTVGTRSNLTKTATYVCFTSGSRFRVPEFESHYPWSKNCSLSSRGLQNLSLQGDEFYWISLQGYSEIAYVYPCKLFEPEEKLKIKE